jgi:phenylpyruvate tautomerase PptA (4-oxalocrotonate tautomerase family)
MPLVRIDLRRGKSAAYKKAICDSVYRALRETFGVPEEDRFMIVTEHAADDLIYSRNYLGIGRDDDLVLLQLTVSNTRDVEQKRALYARIVALLAENPGLRPQNVFINLLEVAPENWSFGNGVAQYVVSDSAGR